MQDAATHGIHEAVAGRRVLVTGAAGFLGGALARWLARSPAAEILLLDQAESGLNDLALELEAEGSRAGHREIVGDVCDTSLLNEIWLRMRPQIVIHAAACKHVGLMERNPFAAARTNVLGTHRLAQAAAQNRVEAMVTVSTDKAVEPVSIMGATKRVAEHLMRAAPPSTRMHAVRLGNVWRSTGSLVPLLERQIAERRPLTITDPACTRSFLPVGVAVERILYALVLGRGRPANFACAAEQTRSVADVVEEVLRGAGLGPGQVATKVIGLRPGERCTERMTGRGERISPEPEGGLHEILGGQAPSAAELANALAEIEAAVAGRELERLLAALLRLVPDYAPSASLLERRPGAPAGAA